MVVVASALIGGQRVRAACVLHISYRILILKFLAGFSKPRSTGPVAER